MKAVTHLEKVIAGEISAVTHLEKVIAQKTTAVTYTEKVIAGTVPPITHLQKVIAGVASPITHLEYVWAGGSPASVQEYTGAVPVTFVADGTPLLDYIISGNTVQNGTPTPDSPITPQGTGERTGNLAPPLADWISGYVDANGNIHSPSDSVQEKASDYLSIEPDTDYVFAFETGTFPTGASGYWSAVGLYDENKAFIRRDAGLQPGTPRVFHTGSDAAYIRLSYRSYGSTLNTMLNSGSEALPYEPYGYKIPISSAGQTTPIYLGEVETTRRIRKLVLTGEEDYVVPNISLRVPIGMRIPAIPFVPLAVISSHFETKGSSEVTQIDSHLYTTRLSQNGGFIWFFVPRDFFSGDLNVDNCEIEYKEWLAQQYAAGTSVTVWYVLATPETEVINEPLMKIGNYADTLSMEQAGVSIPTANGSTTLDVETTVKPSEVYIKYRGEAVATLSALPAEVSSTEATTEEENPEEMEEEENGSEDISLQHKPEIIE